MTPDGVRWLGAALWLQRHGCGWIIGVNPHVVVPVAEALALALAGDDHG